MGYPANWQFESKQIGTAPQTAAAPEARQRVVVREFGVPSAYPLTGGMPIGDFARELESDADIAPRLERARRSLAKVLDDQPNFRQLRLSAGLSQGRLGEMAGTTQSYIARIESGTLDPGTDMLARLAAALGASEVTVFSAVRMQRAQKG